MSSHPDWKSTSMSSSDNGLCARWITTTSDNSSTIDSVLVKSHTCAIPTPNTTTSGARPICNMLVRASSVLGSTVTLTLARFSNSLTSCCMCASSSTSITTTRLPARVCSALALNLLSNASRSASRFWSRSRACAGDGTSVIGL
eukprot:CAMPEP_0198231900 /NCGR_PEP_ID=MMETSP1445-20131203/115442_1 /TAXON_ID=36898 /ORGANISM="Pyramimonas sp., Strain CCMP2087" /LENGTH=143 /DNA_ID=CAMNT_0043912541 /DNA_START=497 /DNA_END=928 /DNA_ORIENTATION=+